MSTSNRRSLASATLVAILFTSVAGCHSTSESTSPETEAATMERNGPPAWAPAHGHRRKFTYTHYPSCNVYFDSERGLWFWIEGRHWKMGVSLPSHVRIEEFEGVTMTLATDNPFEPGSHGRGRKH